MSERRKGSMSDTDRALAGRDRRTPARGVAVIVDEGDGGSFDEADRFTPVSSVIERTADLTDREHLLLRYVWQHTANMEMRARKRSDSSDTSILMKRIDDLEESVVDISGKNGNNGKIGALKERVDKAEHRRWWAITFVAGLVITIVGAAFSFGSRIGALETEVQTLKARAYRAQRNSSSPDYPAAKDPAP